jgi:phosphoenolpyruvate phosphomutase / 2-hydroxyethylphosphonate cytidylyltransferase
MKQNNGLIKMKKQKIVYVPMAVDILHTGHINIIEVARKLGKITLGLLSDKAIVNYKRLPLLSIEKRKKIVENIKGINSIVIQDSHDYEPILRKLKPDYLVHGDDWKTGIQRKARKNVISILSEWGGELIEPEYTKEVSSANLNHELTKNGITPDGRRKLLKRLLSAKPILRVLESHSGLTGCIVEKTRIQKNGEIREFDGLWLSSLTGSTSMGKPDTEVVDFSSRFQTIEEIMEVTTKPIIVDGDTGGKTEHFRFSVRTLERLGVSAIIIEDKIGMKRNSLFGTEVSQKQDTIDNFCNKIKEGNRALVTDEFMIIARIESLILEKGMEDALERAEAYISAGAKGIMIHSKNKDGKEIIDFCKRFNSFKKIVPLVVVPSTFSHMTEKELKKLGVNIVIYGNHLLRSAYPSMVKTAESILKNGRSLEASEKYCMPIKEIITLIPEKY